MKLPILLDGTNGISGKTYATHPQAYIQRLANQILQNAPHGTTMSSFACHCSMPAYEHLRAFLKSQVQLFSQDGPNWEAIKEELSTIIPDKIMLLGMAITPREQLRDDWVVISCNGSLHGVIWNIGL